MQKYLILTLLLILIAVVFTIQNSTSIPVKFIFWEREVPVAVLIFVSLAFGALLGILFSFPKKNKKKENENNELDEMN